MSLTKVTYSMIQGDVVNVLDYGATGDATTDDTAAIQSAIDAAYGKTLFFPKGTYKITNAGITSRSLRPIYGSLHQVGFALTATGETNFIGEPGTIIKFDCGAANTYDVMFRCTNNFFAQQIQFQQQASYFSAACLYLYGSSGDTIQIKIKDCKFTGSFLYAIDLYDFVDGVWIENNIFINDQIVTGLGYATGYGIIADDCRWFKNIFITNNKFIGNETRMDGDAIEINNDGNTIDPNKTPRTADEWSNNLIIDGNIITNYQTNTGVSGLGIGLASGKYTNVTISNNIINNVAEGIHFENNKDTTNVKIIGNTIYKCNRVTAGNPAGIGIYCAGGNINSTDRLIFKDANYIISNNNVVGGTDGATTSMAFAISIQSLNGVLIQGNILDGVQNVPYEDGAWNNFSSFTYCTVLTGIYIQGNANNCVVKDNTIRNMLYGVQFREYMNGTFNSFEQNYFADCYASFFSSVYNLTNQAQQGMLRVEGNRHVGCNKIFLQPNSAAYCLGINAKNEWIGSIPMDQVIYGSNDAGVPAVKDNYGIISANRNYTYDSNNTAYAAYGTDGFPIGSLIYDSSGGGGTDRVKIVTSPGTLWTGAGNVISVDWTNGSNIVTFSIGDINVSYFAEGCWVKIAGVSFIGDVSASYARVVKIDPDNLKIYLSATVNTAGSGTANMGPIVATTATWLA